MCGIAGFVGLDIRDRQGALHAMQAALAHRGPDDRGHHLDGTAALAMTRLAIIDPAHGAQPKVAARGDLQIVMNGEIYNHAQLREELSREGASFESHSDTEVVAKGFEVWGPSCVERLDGMFAIAAWDRRSGRLTLARDRFGEKPLYLWPVDGGLAFASEPKALRRLRPLPDVDVAALDNYLRLGYVPAPQSIWKGIRKLRPGWMATFDAGGYSEQQFWRLEREGTWSNGVDPVDHLAQLLRSAVETRMVADVEVATLLSGGVDSTLVTWAASQVQPNLRTFTVGFDDPSRDETGAAAAVAARLGTVHEELRVTSDDALSVVHDLTSIYDEPFADSSAIPTLLLCRFTHKHVKVALSGDGGDELFSGYVRYGLMGALNALQRIAPRALTGALAPLGLRYGGLPGRLGNYFALLGPSTSSTYLNRSGLLTATALRALTRREPPAELAAAADAVFQDFPGRGPQALDLHSYLPDDLLVKVDRASMSTGLEVRLPFLEPNLVTWAMSLSDEDLGAPGAKALPRRLLARHFPPEIADKPKQGFSVPLAQWLRGPLRSLLNEHLSDRALATHGLVDPSTVAVLRRRLEARRKGTAGPLWALLAFQLWWNREP